MALPTKTSQSIELKQIFLDPDKAIARLSGNAKDVGGILSREEKLEYAIRCKETQRIAKKLEDMGEEQTEDVLADLLVQLVPFWEKVAGREVMLDVLNMCKGFPIKAEQPLLPPPQTESSTPILSARVIAAAKKLPGAESIKDWNMDTLAQLLASTAKIVRDQIAQLPPVSTRSSMSPSETSSPLTSRSSHTQTPTRRLPPIYVGVEVIEFDSSQSSDALPTIPSTKDSPLDLSVDNLTIDSSTEVHQ